MKGRLQTQIHYLKQPSVQPFSFTKSWLQAYTLFINLSWPHITHLLHTLGSLTTCPTIFPC